jgi:hypothetical protein
MKMNWKYALFVGALAVGSLLTVACDSATKTETPTQEQAGKEIAAQKSGDLVIMLENAAGELKQGQNQFVITFRSAAGKPVDVGTVTVGSSMAMPGMAPMVAQIELKSAGRTGAYEVGGDFAMSGAWMFDVRWNGPAGQGSTTFSANVR